MCDLRTMRNTNAHSLNEVINELMDAYHLRGKLAEVRIRSAWEQLMGTAIANRTHTIQLKDKTLTVYLNSSVLRQELSYKSLEIIRELNTLFETETVDSIIFR